MDYPRLSAFRKHAEHQRTERVTSLHKLVEDSSSKEEFLERMHSVSRLTLKLIEIRTRKQSNSPHWFLYRRHAMTASISHTLYHAQRKGSTKFRIFALIASVNHIKTKIPAMLWGNEKEDTALKAYQHKCQMTDPLHRVYKSGLVLDSDFCAWGGSPDAVGVRGDGTKYLIEIKCPFSFSTDSLRKNGVEKLQYLEEGPALKRTHQYFFQIQTLMGIMKLDMCHFIVWCPNDFLVLEIPADTHFYNDVREKCIKYYTDVYLNHIFR